MQRTVVGLSGMMLSMHALILGVFQRCDAKAGVGTVLTMVLPCVMWMLILWVGLFPAWYWLGLPWAV